MYVGIGIFFAAVGAVLSFAVTDSINGVDLTVVGYILMGAGVLAVVMSFIFTDRARRTAVVEQAPVEVREVRDPRY